MDWKKEYRVSDLLRNRERPERAPMQPPAPSLGEVGSGGSATAPTPGARENDASVWKKEIRLSGLFRRKRPASPRRPLALPVPGSTVEDAPTPEASRLSARTAPAAAEPPRETTSEAPGDTVPGAAPKADVPAGQAETHPDVASPAAAASQPAWRDEAGRKPEPPSKGAKTPSAGQPGRRPKVDKPQRAERRSSRADGKLPAVPLMRSLNLLPRDVKLAKTTMRPVFAHVGVAFVALLVAGGLGVLYYTKQQEVVERESTIEDKKAEIAAIQSIQATPEDGRAELAGEALARATALSSALQSRVGWDRLLRELSLTLPDDVWFNSVITATSATPSVPAVGGDVGTAPVAPVISTTSSLTIGGYAMNQERIAQLLARLEAIPTFSAVQLQSADRVELGDTSVIQFSVVGALK